MPEDMDPEAAKHITPILKEVMSKILHGGGLGKAGLNFASLCMQLQGVAMSYQLCIPPYFTNVLRAFGTIEGIALKVDPSYSIVQVCMNKRKIYGEHALSIHHKFALLDSYVAYLVL